MNVRVDMEVVELEPTPAVVFARKAGRRPLHETATAGIQKVRKAVTAARVPTAGPPFLRYLTLDERPEVELGLPLEGPHSVPSLRTTILPGGRAATIWHTDPGLDIRSSLDDLHSWVTTRAEVLGDPWQWYWTEPDAEQPRIQIVWPMR